jgi:hypothetical protein
MLKVSKALFCDHPASVDETYTEHMAAAVGFALRLFVAGFVCSVHAVLPFLFVKTGSTMIAELHDRILFVAGFVCSVHAVLPFIFVKTGSTMIAELHDRMVTNRRRLHGTAGAQTAAPR